MNELQLIWSHVAIHSAEFDFGAEILIAADG